MSDQAQNAVSLDDLAESFKADDSVADEELDNEQQEAEEEAPEEPAEGQEAEEPQPETLKLKFTDKEGKEVEEEVTPDKIAEWKSLAEDYHHKRQVEANQTRQVQQEYIKAIDTANRQSLDTIEKLKAFVFTMYAPDLNALTPQMAEDDPIEYNKLAAKRDYMSQVLSKLDAHKAQLDDERQRLETEAYEQRRAETLVNAQDYLKQHVPEYFKEGFEQKFVPFVEKTYGITRNDLIFLSNAPEFKAGGVFDSGNLIRILNDAMKFHETKANKPIAMNKVNQAPKIIKPSAPVQRSQNEAALKRLKESGRVEDLAAFFR